jgi:hypothetical protein
MAQLIRADGTSQDVVLPFCQNDLLGVLRGCVGGSLELIPLSDGQRMLVNAEGVGLGLPRNNLATRIARQDLHADDWIKGDALVCVPGELESADSEVWG